VNGLQLNQVIRIARTKAGMSQQALGRAVGVSKAAVSSWELGHTRPSPEHLQALTRVFVPEIGRLLQETASR
jgi:transcriptional regulator with XRE-family HTH domain